MYSPLTRQRDVCEEIRKEMVKDDPKAKLIQFRGLFYSKKKTKEKNSKSSSLMID